MFDSFFLIPEFYETFGLFNQFLFYVFFLAGKGPFFGSSNDPSVNQVPSGQRYQAGERIRVIVLLQLIFQQIYLHPRKLT